MVKDTPKNAAPLYCFRVWFSDGAAMLVDAHSISEARKLGEAEVNRCGGESLRQWGRPLKVNRVEKLS